MHEFSLAFADEIIPQFAVEVKKKAHLKQFDNSSTGAESKLGQIVGKALGMTIHILHNISPARL